MQNHEHDDDVEDDEEEDADGDPVDADHEGQPPPLLHFGQHGDMAAMNGGAAGFQFVVGAVAPGAAREW